MFITIIGTGEIGQAIHKLLSPKGFTIEVWDRNSSKAPSQKSLESIIPSSDIIFLCIPSWAIREVAAAITGYLKKDSIIVSVSKGIEEKSGKTIDELLEGLFSLSAQYAILGGPMLAEELKADMIGVGAVGAKNSQVFDELRNVFADTSLYLEFTDDIRGVALCGVLKNIYAISLGIAEGLGYGNNAKGWLTNLAVKEMVEIVTSLGGRKETVFSTAGIGDFIATGFSQYSSNRQVGFDLGKHGNTDKKSEGLVALPVFIKRIDTLERFILLHAISEVVLEHKDAKTAFRKVFTTHG